MKITLAVLFLAGLTIYCKCTAVLSLPPSLIARSASLERTQTTPTQTKDNGDRAGGGGGVVGDGGPGGGTDGVGGDGGFQDAVTALDDDDDDDDGDGDVAGNVAQASELFKNVKNLWQQDFRLQKRERNAFEDDIAAVVAAPQQQQSLSHPANAAIKSNKNVLQQLATITQQQQPAQPHDNGNNKFLKMKSSATTNSNYPFAEIEPLARDEENDDSAATAATENEEYDSNEWLAAPGPKMTDDIIVSPPSPALLPPLAAIDDDVADGDVNVDDDVVREALQDFLPSVASTSDLDQATADDSVSWNQFLRPLKYWDKQCQTTGGNENNCPQDYYRALIADRNNAFLKQIHYKHNMAPFVDPLTHRFVAPPDLTSDDLLDDYADTTLTSAAAKTPNIINNDDIVLLLTAEQKLIQFLTWALAEMYPLGKFSNATLSGADNYDPSMFVWKKFNLSGRLEPPLFVQEPRYVIVRREYDPDDDYKRGLHYRDDPFIPPRGRKHNLPDLDALLQRYETFVPNRGRRDKIKDIFKYDDLFYPNRGKRQIAVATNAANYGDNDSGHEGEDDNIKAEQQQQQQHQQLLQAINGENLVLPLTHPLTKTLEHINNLMAKMKRKLQQLQLQQSLANSFDEMSNKRPATATATRMSTAYQASAAMPPPRLSKRLKSMVNILQQQRRQHFPNSNRNNNGRRQWWKRYSANTIDRPMATERSRTGNTNRLHALRSMSPQQQQQPPLALQQQQQQQQDMLEANEYLSPPRLYQPTKFMWQESQRQARTMPSATDEATTQQHHHQQHQSLAQQFDPLSWHKLQLLQHQYHLPLLTATMRHPRLTAATAARLRQRPHPFNGKQQQHHLATPQETQLTYRSHDNSLANDLKNLYNKDYV